MPPSWTSSDLLPLVCSHLTAVQDLAALSQVNKAINNYLFSTTGGKHWIHAGKLMCGEEYWPANPLELTEPRYLTMIYMCPWVSKPTRTWLTNRQAKLATKSTHPIPLHEQLTIHQLRESKCIPETEYDKIGRAFKVHDGVLMVLTCPTPLVGHPWQTSMYGQPYFISSKDYKLLRDMSYAKNIKRAVWIISPGNLKAIDIKTHYQWQFIPRNDKAILPRKLCAKTEQACWYAFKGDIERAFEELQGSDPHNIQCRNLDFPWYVIYSGSVEALRKLLHSNPEFANHDNLICALQKKNEEMARLILDSSSDKLECIGWNAIVDDLRSPAGLAYCILKELSRSNIKITLDGKTAFEMIQELMRQDEEKAKFLEEFIAEEV